MQEQYIIPGKTQNGAALCCNSVKHVYINSCIQLFYYYYYYYYIIIIDYILFNFTYNIICFIALEKGFTQFSLIDC